MTIVRTTTVTLNHAAAPPSAGPDAEVHGLAFLDDQTGFLATGSRAGVSGTGRIERTDDGGDSWRTVWSEDDVSLSWLGFADATHGFASGLRGNGAPNTPASWQALLLTTDDGGATWQERVPVLPAGMVASAWYGLHFDFPDAGEGFAFADLDFCCAVRPPLLRSRDGGLTWTTLGVDSLAIGAVQFLSPALGFAAGRPSDGSCAGEVLRTSDASDHWTPLPGSCRAYALYAVDFLDTAHGFAAGGILSKCGTTQDQFIIAASDAGQSWTEYSHPADARCGHVVPAVRLAFSDARHGFYAAGGCQIGQNGPCPGRVFATDDGGQSWRDTGQIALRIAVTAAGHAWLYGGGAVIFRTRDGGRTWQPLARPANVFIYDLKGAGGWLTIATDAGLFLSEDADQHWRPIASAAGSPSPPRMAPASAPGVLLMPTSAGAVRISSDAGQPWTAVPLPGAGPDAGYPAVAVAADGRTMLAGEGGVFDCGRQTGGALTFTSTDGGHSWQAGAVEPFEPDTIAIAPGLAVVAGFTYCGYGVAVSTDGAQHWRSQRLPAGGCSAVGVTPPAIWLVCQSLPGGGGLLVSQDAGATWEQLILPRDAPGIPSGVAVVAPGEAWISAGAGALWHTADGGASWQEAPLVLPTP